MYYNLTKEEYKKYEKQFKKTYVGKKIFNDMLFSLIIGTIFWCVTGGFIGYNSVDSLNINLTEFATLFVGGLVLIEALLWKIEFKRELKCYIESINKKESK